MAMRNARDGGRACEVPDWHAARSRQCYRSSAAPNRTSARLAATPPIPIPTPTPIPNGCAESAALLVVDGGGEELAGAVVEAAVLKADPDTEDTEAEAEVDDGTKERKEREVGFVAAAWNCSTRASAEVTSQGHARRVKGKIGGGEEDAQRSHAEAVDGDLGGAARSRCGETQAVRCRARQLAYKHEEVAHALHDDTPLREGSAAELRHSAGISVHNPHSALDGVFGGMNDRLASCIGADPQKVVSLETKPASKAIGGDGCSIRPSRWGARRPHKKEPPPLAELFGWGTRPCGPSTIAICAGYGGSMASAMGQWFTGEMEHHEVLAAPAARSHCGHTNTERGYLPLLRDKLRALDDPDAEVVISLPLQLV
ncbi:hypothetical protein FB451DRAFT_1532364 [Mycena latifolia]|nr:hypothetical protein FB451DRAFT_1532364 [Mycena latifolia]